VQKRLLFWVVVAWADDFTGSIVDYGAFPEQGRNYFTYTEAGHTLQSKSGSSQLEAAVRWGLDALTTNLFSRAWQREGGGETRIDRAFVDANYGESTDAVYEFCRRTPYSGIILPSHGRGIKAGDKPMDQYQKRPGETHGFHWYVTPGDGKRAIKHLIADANFWKTFLAARAKALIGERGSLSVFGTKEERHRMLLDHLKAESPVQTFGRGREVWEWKDRPGVDNHWLDCLVLAGIAASMAGCALDNLPLAAPDQKKRVKFSDMQKARRG
jgi:phage terminase large subunit GpA-like protein